MIKFGDPWAVGLQVGVKEVINVNFILSNPN